MERQALHGSQTGRTSMVEGRYTCDEVTAQRPDSGLCRYQTAGLIRYLGTPYLPRYVATIIVQQVTTHLPT